MFDFGYAITDDKFNILYYNEAFSDYLATTHDLLNKKITVLFPDYNINSKEEMVRVKLLNNNEYYLIRNEIKLNRLELNMFFICDYSVNRELENQISYFARQQYMYNEMLNKLEDGIYITDEKGKTLFVNDAFVKLSGLSKETVVGETVYSLRDRDILPNSCCSKVIELKDTVFTMNNYYKGQKCLVSGSPIYDEQGRFVKTIAVIRDVTELESLMKSVTVKGNITKNNTINVVNKDKKVENTKIFTNNKNMRALYERAKKIADFDSTVLILGETGVGKDFMASYIYETCSLKGKGKFIKINCGAVPEQLLESEFFGYEDGAFTGAVRGGKKGLFEEANNGVLFLDEIGDMPYTLQVKLLNALNDKVFYRIGGTTPITFNARIIAATNADLKQLVYEKKFRLDLYYRLNVVRFVIPPLRQRKEDIISLSQQFMDFYNNKYGKNCFLSGDCVEDLIAYYWPGNIREMKNVIERLVLIADNAAIDSRLFREQLIMGESDYIALMESSSLYNKSMTLKERVEQFEKEEIIRTIEHTETLREAADELGIDISTLVRKKQKYGIY